MNTRKNGAAIWLILLLLIGAIWAVNVAMTSPAQKPADLGLSTFISEVQSGKVQQIVVEDNKIYGLLKDGSRFTTYLPAPPSDQSLSDWVSRGIEVRVQAPRSSSMLTSILIPILIIGVLFAVFWYLSRGSRAGDGGGAFGFTKSRAKVLAESPKTSFKDVAGAEEAKEELGEIVEFLKSPERFHRMGARIPRGVLLVGPPGSGKTHIARAVAGEARVPFIAASGSDFVEMFVGVGAARVRDLFETAKKNSPCIIFIDEIDAVGRKRGGSFGGGNDEREQTLNQLLVEMDGFDKETSVIIMAATNRPDVLDPALLRPGRFDRQVSIDAPDIRGREQILRIHAVGKPLAEDVDLALVARRTPGFVGADLENLLNEAALLAARERRRKITMKDLEEAADRVTMGPAKKSMVFSEADKRITAYHEAGHALAAHYLKHADGVHKITIMPRGRALGFMMPEREDVLHWTKKRLLDQIAVALAGRASEELVFDDVTTGAENDFRQATELAWRMITEWGMHPEFGQVAYQERQDTYLGGHEVRRYSEHTAHLIDEAVRKLIDEQYERITTLLKDKKAELERVAEALLEVETLNAQQFISVLNGEPLAGGDKDPDKKKDATQVIPKAKIRGEAGLGGA